MLKQRTFYYPVQCQRCGYTMEGLQADDGVTQAIIRGAECPKCLKWQKFEDFKECDNG